MIIPNSNTNSFNSDSDRQSRADSFQSVAQQTHYWAHNESVVSDIFSPPLSRPSSAVPLNWFVGPTKNLASDPSPGYPVGKLSQCAIWCGYLVQCPVGHR